MDVRVFPSEAAGEIQAPPSKSAAHRALICAGLCRDSQTVSRVWPVDRSEDMSATRSGLTALGTEVLEEKAEDGRQALQVKAIGVPDETLTEVDCGESGSTYRFFLPILAALGRRTRFTGRGKLPSRPMGPMFELLKKKGVCCDYPSGKSLPLEISGMLSGGLYPIRGDLSSQYITGLLFALPLLPEDSEIRLTTKLESAPYVEMTLNLLEESGIQIDRLDSGFAIPGGQSYRGGEYLVEGDYSNAAFPLCAGAVCGGEPHVKVSGLLAESAQGDRKIVELLSRFGADVAITPDFEPSGDGKSDQDRVSILVRRRTLHGIEIDAGDIPDLVPVLAATAVFAEGETRIFNAGRLRIKESDRLSAISNGLSRIGADITEYSDSLLIRGGRRLAGGCEVYAENDHRIAMALSVAAMGCEEPVLIRGAECVRKSYPCYFEELRKLGGKADVINLG